MDIFQLLTSDWIINLAQSLKQLMFNAKPSQNATKNKIYTVKAVKFHKNISNQQPQNHYYHVNHCVDNKGHFLDEEKFYLRVKCILNILNVIIEKNSMYLHKMLKYVK